MIVKTSPGSLLYRALTRPIRHSCSTSLANSSRFMWRPCGDPVHGHPSSPYSRIRCYELSLLGVLNAGTGAPGRQPRVSLFVRTNRGFQEAE